MQKFRREDTNNKVCDKCNKSFERASNNELMICAAPDKKGKNIKFVCGKCYQILVNELIEQQKKISGFEKDIEYLKTIKDY